MPDKKEQNKVISDDIADLRQGHRERLREKVLAMPLPVGPEVQDYEILEFLLAVIIPRKDVKSLAKILINRFEDLAGVLNADTADLMEIKGIKENTAAAIKTVNMCMQRAARNRISKAPVIGNSFDLLNYCRLNFGYEKIEKASVIYLGAGNRFLCDEVVNKGTLDGVFFYPQEILRKAIKVGALHIILIHNHPSGCAAPSVSDSDLTDSLEGMLLNSGITLYDHVIISSNDYFSFRSKGLLRDIDDVNKTNKLKKLKGK